MTDCASAASTTSLAAGGHFTDFGRLCTVEVANAITGIPNETIATIMQITLRIPMPSPPLASGTKATPQFSVTENGLPPSVQYRVLPARASESGSISDDAASTWLPAASTEWTSTSANASLVLAIQAIEPSRFTTMAVVSPLPISPGSPGNPFGILCMTAPFTRLRTTFRLKLCPRRIEFSNTIGYYGAS